MEKITSLDMFEQCISLPEPAIMVFTADWCPDCRRMEMFIDDIIAEYTQYKWYEVDRDAFPTLAETYEVMGIPSLLLFQDGEKIAHLHSANAKTPQQVRDFLAQL
ncbi:thioredoxin family protein [Bacillus chungangensis]|uniref:Thioredoxin-like negative regulator of GroEL n=1 Tax=Bacillus chungangensis TaxID=587633 RepID=A0ABT9WWS7_9BACI|nr:thioredoxin family protein [Bacillus chungangensis]MDQ0177573.1 thioredoxin-like negative regulator of GroEL [Bacillus chungangensis]